MIAGVVIVLIKCDNEQAVVRLGPFHIGAEMVLKPSIAVAHPPLVDGTVKAGNDVVEMVRKPRTPTSPMHVVVQIGNDEGYCWQLREVVRQLRQVSFYLSRIAERLPRIVFPR